MKQLIIQCVCGSVHRERQRIASLLIDAKCPDKLVRGILDDSQDPNIFRLNGPDVGINDPPTRISD